MTTRPIPPDATAPDDLATLQSQQAALATHIRDPSQPPPPGLDPRRLQVYRDLFFNSLRGLLTANFPVLARLRGDAAWTTLLRDFYRDWRCATPLFPELPREFLQYLAQRDVAADPPWQQELAHYEWAELALDLAEADPADVPHVPDGDLRAGWPVVSPLVWVLAYTWPVHRLAPDFLPDVPPAQPTFLLLRRDARQRVRFHETTALVFRLLQSLAADSHASGEALLRALATEAQAPDVESFVEEGLALLRQLRADGVLLGTRVG